MGAAYSRYHNYILHYFFARYLHHAMSLCGRIPGHAINVSAAPQLVQRQSESGPRGDIASGVTRLPTYVGELILRPSASLRLLQRARFESEHPPFRPRSVAFTRLLFACLLFLDRSGMSLCPKTPMYSHDATTIRIEVRTRRRRSLVRPMSGEGVGH